ncbi:MAG: NAD(P)H-dependent oxidoreductase subunit E [Bacteroidia bacterium]|nr:NAD(P)H-dependent oxidoreductase subunit E [Bacteroidia bacterium]
MNFQFSSESIELISKIIKRYPEGRQKSALIPVLHIAQAENHGWLTTEIMNQVAEMLQIQPIEVYEVATFYSMFSLKPVGKCIIEICMTGPCCLSGAEELLAYLESKLGIKAGETTPDGMITLKKVECLAACGGAPVIKNGFNYYENMNFKKADLLLEKCTHESFTSHSNPYHQSL